jgi:hypothetical protein
VRTKIVVSVLFAASVLEAGCGTASLRHATISGVVAPCVGAATNMAFERIPVLVTLREGAKQVSTQLVHGRGNYTFRVSPGNYRISTNQGLPAVHFVLRAGESEHANFTPSCH